MNHQQTLTNCTVLTVDSADTFYPRGRIVVTDGRITAIGNEDTVALQGEVVDMGGSLVMPGLINTHTHSYSAALRNAADDLKLMDWLQTAIWPMEARLSYERSMAASTMSCLEYLQCGITTYVDMFYYTDATAKAAQRSGLRCFLAAAVFSNPIVETADSIGAAERFIRAYKGREEETLVYPCIGPHAPYTVTAETWKQCMDIADRYQVLLHTHLSETADENRQIFEQTGMSPTAWLESMGVFDRPTLLAHSIHLSDEDLDIYAKHGAAVSYNPVSNLKLVSGIMPLKKMWERGISVSLGTDGAQSNNSMDLLRDLRTGVLIQKQLNDSAAFFNAREAVRMVTIDGARAIGMEDRLGSLEIGKYADLIALNTESPRLCPLHRESLKNLYATVTYSACGADVRDSMVNGRWVMRDGRVLSMDAEQVRKDAQEAAAYMAQDVL